MRFSGPVPPGARLDNEPQIGWRIWRLDVSTMELRPSFFVSDFVWPAGEPLIAKCYGRWPDNDHFAPKLGCSCGIWARNNADEARLDYAQRLVKKPFVGNSIPVWGTCSLWGLLVTHERGWRASYAYPYEVFIPDRIPIQNPWYIEDLDFDYDPDGVAASLRARYGIDVAIDPKTPTHYP